MQPQIFTQWLLYLHEIVKDLYFHYSLSVCVRLSVCVCDCLWTKFQPNECTDLDAVFAVWLQYRIGSNPVEICDFGSKVKVRVTLY